VAERGIAARIGNDQRLVHRDRMLAERIGERRLAFRAPRFGKADGALEELPIAVHQRDESDRRLAQARREPRQPIEWLLWRRVEKGRSLELREPVQIVDNLETP